MSNTKPRWTPPNWPKSWVEILEKGGARIAQPDDPIYTNASWRISFVSRTPRAEPEEPSAANGKQKV